ncbi:hypothetical protein BV25DRAFT_1470011 [Artomyces pyxidatus]|uniref:Uncharacterized protein n=1 Tax=Artomyces pyxidatus TaxID=48021 RepID=A0ACB8SK82_9AGAM|nr:hypothetical protein BV25DRAFT_1470011 [Artomyces pyxidatus]
MTPKELRAFAKPKDYCRHASEDDDDEIELGDSDDGFISDEDVVVELGGREEHIPLYVPLLDYVLEASQRLSCSQLIFVSECSNHVRIREWISPSSMTMTSSLSSPQHLDAPAIACLLQKQLPRQTAASVVLPSAEDDAAHPIQDSDTYAGQIPPQRRRRPAVSECNTPRFPAACVRVRRVRGVVQSPTQPGAPPRETPWEGRVGRGERARTHWRDTARFVDALLWAGGSPQCVCLSLSRDADTGRGKPGRGRCCSGRASGGGAWTGGELEIRCPPQTSWSHNRVSEVSIRVMERSSDTYSIS